MFKKLRGVFMGVIVKSMVEVWKLEAKIEGRYTDTIKSGKGKYKYKINFMKPLTIICSELQERILELEEELRNYEKGTDEHKELLNFIFVLSYKELVLRVRALEEIEG